MPSSMWMLKSVVLFLNAGKRKKKENGLIGRKTNTLLRRKRKPEEEPFEEVVLTDEIWYENGLFKLIFLLLGPLFVIIQVHWMCSNFDVSTGN
jgi:hypothetical protein